MNPNVLLVEDDERLARFTEEYLQKHSVDVTRVDDGERALVEALRHRYDVILLDLMLPRRTGIEVCKALRERSDVPILIITARGDEADRVLGLEVGADDYVTKPFSARELLARIRALFRRDHRLLGPGATELKSGKLGLHFGRQEASWDGVDLSLTGVEFELLAALVRHSGRALNREQLLDLVHGSAEEAFNRAIDVYVSRLRHKLGPDAARQLHTVRGQGYRWSDAA